MLLIHENKVGVFGSDEGMSAALIRTDRLIAQACKRIDGVFLGEHRDSPVFLLSCDNHPSNVLQDGIGDMIFSELRQVSIKLPNHQASLPGFGQAMDYWHKRHRFCGVCGHATRSDESGHSRDCTNRDCETTHLPRTDPAIIVLAYDADASLMGRQRGWPDRRYSALAGYIEPGESPEQAVTREVLEETGVEVNSIKYFASQPWPFPGSLMLGFYANAKRQSLISLNDSELQDARWFTRQEIIDNVSATRLRLPSRISIAYRLLENWFNHNNDTTLDAINPDTY